MRIKNYGRRIYLVGTLLAGMLGGCSLYEKLEVNSIERILNERNGKGGCNIFSPRATRLGRDINIVGKPYLDYILESRKSAFSPSVVVSGLAPQYMYIEKEEIRNLSHLIVSNLKFYNSNEHEELIDGINVRVYGVIELKNGESIELIDNMSKQDKINGLWTRVSVR